MLINVTPELAMVFGTPMAFRTVANAAALNEGLERAILMRAQSQSGNTISNIGGWQSQTDLLDWPEPPVAQLKTELDRSIQAISTLPALLEGRPPDQRVGYTAYGWVNVNQNGHYNTPHIHTACDWSAVYYVATGSPHPDTPINGRIEFRDPRPTAAYSRTPGFIAGQPLRLKPQAGMMVIFPAWVEHWVHPFFGDGKRISIAINVTIDRER